MGNLQNELEELEVEETDGERKLDNYLDYLREKEEMENFLIQEEEKARNIEEGREGVIYS